MSTTPSPDWQPTLRGPRITLRPVRPDDLDPLHEAASDPEIWAQHSEPDRHERPVFERFFAGLLGSGGGLVIIDNASGRVIGSSRYYDWNPADASVVIGYTHLERASWGGVTNAELKSLMLAHAFGFARTVWFHVSHGNLRSQRALERIGARLDWQGTVLLGGVPHERMVYRIDRD
jgi:RimJ/RimL family protein N-acetyltransferase